MGHSKICALPLLLVALPALASIRFENVDEDGHFFERRIIERPYSPVARPSNPPTLVTVMAKTFSSNRVNVVFAGDGYTSREIPKYASEVDSRIQEVLQQEPFKSYANYFQFIRLDVISKDSGVTNDPQGTVRDTALGMEFYCDGIDRLLCADINRVMSEVSAVPKVDIVFALANSSTYGGAGYTEAPLATMSSRNARSLEVALHEFGHSFANLGDEYESAGPTDIDCPSLPDISSEDAATMKANKSKWYRWLDLAHVGTIQGGCYSSSHFYRPTQDSKMRSLNRPFEEVNVEQLVINIYKRVKPIESIAPAAGSYSGHQVFKLVLMKPSRHSLIVEWRLDGRSAPQLGGKSSIDSSQLGLASGAHTISVTVTDNTAAVRDPKARRDYLTQSVNWTLQLP